MYSKIAYFFKQMYLIIYINKVSVIFYSLVGGCKLIGQLTSIHFNLSIAIAFPHLFCMHEMMRLLHNRQVPSQNWRSQISHSAKSRIPSNPTSIRTFRKYTAPLWPY